MRAIVTGLAALAVVFALSSPVEAEVVLFQATPLTKAVETNDVTTVKTRLGKGDNANTIDPKGRSVLIIAVSAGFSEVAVALIEAGANPERPDQTGNSALHLAAQRGDVVVIDKALSRTNKVDIENREGMTPLMMAAKAGQAGAVERLLKGGANPNRADFTGRTVSEWAKEGRSAKVVGILQRAGAR